VFQVLNRKVFEMERDFLGVIGKESGSLAKDDGRSNRMDSVSYGNGSRMQWPFSNKSATLPPFMSIKTMREEKSDQFSISGFQPKSENPTPPVVAQQYAVRGYMPRHPDSYDQNPNGSRVFPAVPFPQNNPFIKVNNKPNQQNFTVAPLKQNSYTGGINMNNHFMGSTIGVFPPRDLPKPAPAAQLTIFYAGSVCSFDNVPLDKAKEILILASKASAQAAPPAPPVPSSETAKLETPVKTTEPDSSKITNLIQNPIQNNTTLPIVSSSVSLVSQNNNNNNGTLSRSGSSSNNTESNLPKPLSPLGPTSQPDPSSSMAPKLSTGVPSGTPSLPAGLGVTTATAIMPRAVPQARKASLARFLERRKERVSSVAPYPCNKNTSENCEKSENSNLSSKPCHGIFDLSKNCEDSFSISQSTNNSYSGEAPNTKLQI